MKHLVDSGTQTYQVSPAEMVTLLPALASVGEVCVADFHPSDL